MYTKKQRHILKTALKLSCSYGLRAVTMDEIAKATGMSKKTIYCYFSDKKAVVDGVYESILHIVGHRVNKILLQPANAVYQYIQLLQLAMAAGNYLPPTVMAALQKQYASTYNKLRHFTENKFMPAIRHCIQAGNREGLFQPGFDSNLVSEVCVSQLSEAGRIKIAHLSPEAIQQQLIRQLLYGIATDAGRKETDHYFSSIQKTRSII